MSLSGHVATLPLADLIQIETAGRRSCCIHVAGGAGVGGIYLDRGELVHAFYSDLSGADAFYSLLAESDLSFEVEEGEGAPERTLSGRSEHLLLEAARLQDEGQVPRPSIVIPPPRRSARLTAGTPRRMLQIGMSVLLPLLGATWWLSRPSRGAVRGAEQSAQPARAVEAARLTGPSDAPARLIDGPAPASPDPRIALAPTIVCRVLVGADGRVAEASIHHPRPEVALFEDAALRAIRGYRFEAARQGGQPVAAWLSWPVTFSTARVATGTVLRIKGSDTIGEALGPDLARGFMDEHPGSRVVVESLGSATAFAGLFDGTADLGASSRPVSEAELGEARRLGITLQETVIGYDGVAIIVHPSNPIRSLTLDQAADLFAGRIKSWREVGGPDQPVRLVGRPSYSGTNAFFAEKVLRHGRQRGGERFAPGMEIWEHGRDVARRVAEEPGAVGYVGLAGVGERVRALPLQTGGAAVAPSRAAVRSGAYPLTRPLLLYSRRGARGEVLALLRFAVGARARSG